MDPRRQMSEDEFEEFQKKLMDLDDEFHFKCRKCGKCCTRQHSIIFTARDIFIIAKKLGVTPQKVIEEYTDVYIGAGSNIPIVNMVPRGKREECPFLEDGKCSIHDSKPTACALYPLGRAMTGDLTGKEKSVKYFLQDTDCGSRKQVHTVREWLGRFNIPENDEFFFLWSDVVAALARGFRILVEGGASERVKGTLWDIVYTELYLKYDTEKEFLPQFRATAGHLMRLPQVVEELLAKEGK